MQIRYPYQTEQWCQTMKRLGHEYMKVDGNYVHYKSVPLVGTFVKCYYPLVRLDVDHIKEKLPGIVSVECVSDESLAGFQNEPNHTVWVNLGQNESVILSSFNKTVRNTVRRYIRKEKDSGVSVESDRSSDGFEAFWKILQHTAQRGEFHCPARPIVETVFHEASLSHLFICRHRDKPIAAFMTVHSKDVAYFYYGGTYADAFSTYASYVGHWTIIKHYNELGLKVYDMGGVGYSDRYHFKKGWGQLVTLYCSRRVVSRAPYALLGLFRRTQLIRSLYYGLKAKHYGD